MHPPLAALMFSEENGAMGGALHIKRRHDALFLDNRTSTIEKQFKNIAGVTATGCIIYNPVVCCEDCVSSTHTLRVPIYSNVGVSLSVYLLGLWKA